MEADGIIYLTDNPFSLVFVLVIASVYAIAYTLEKGDNEEPPTGPTV